MASQKHTKMGYVDLSETAWMDSAACAGLDPALFFPARGDTRSLKAGKEVCEGCPVMEPCREYALRHYIEHGTWGATSDRERRRIRRTRAKAAAGG